MYNKQNLNNLRHSAAHLLAAAVLNLYPGTHNAIGPSIDEGFYQDFDFADRKISESDLPKIEQKMRELVKQWGNFQVKEVSIDQAKKDFAHNPYKIELIEEFEKEGKTITENNPDNFLDLCKGGHIENPKENLKHFKLMSVAGAYWRGSEKNKMLTRIYGTAFFTKKELDDYLLMLQEAEKRDHKKIGPQLDLFIFHETSPGMPYWLPKGLILYNQLMNFSKRIHNDFGYFEVATPILNKKDLYETSGHWFHYRDDMFISPMSFLHKDSNEAYEGTETFGVKPMNCPNAMIIFGSKTRSYRDLPMRLSETSVLHRFELSGTLNGLFRAREFRQDDAHIFITTSQVKEEFENIMKMIEIFYLTFNLKYKLRFGTRPNKSMGETEDWQEAERSLKKVLDESGKEYFVAEKEGAFYGPKIDILMRDNLGREWQTGTIQLDFQQPKNFNLKYVDQNGKDVQPVVLHRAIYGSFERFLAILIEHYAGKFPLWLSPIQVALLPISDKHIEYAKSLNQELKTQNIRTILDDSAERLQAKIRTHTLQRAPFLGIIGDKEVEKQSIAVRTQDGKDLGVMKINDFLKFLKEKIDKKA